MNEIILLLKTTFILLSLISSNPDLSIEVKQQILLDATKSIVVAQNQLNELTRIKQIDQPLYLSTPSIQHSCSITATSTKLNSSTVNWESTESNGMLWVNDGSIDGGDLIYKYNFKLASSTGSISGIRTYEKTNYKAVFTNSVCYYSL